MAEDGNRNGESFLQEKTKKIPLSNFQLSVQLKYVKLGYQYLITQAMYLSLIPLLCIVSVHLSTLTIQDWVLSWDQLKFNLVTVLLCSAPIVSLATLYFMSRPKKILLVDFSCFKPGPENAFPKELFMENSTISGAFSDENLAFQQKILERSGLGQKTYSPPALLQVPPNPCMAEARKEAEMVMFGAIDEILAKTGLKANDIGILVVNCSLFNPTPSLSSMVVNHYKLRENILSYNLGGMGCSAGLISIDLAKQLLQARKEAEMVMFGAIDELLTKTGLKANDIGILVVNCSLFNPTLSLSSMVVNHYRLRKNILSYKLGGWDVAGLISIDLAKQLLQVHPNSYALVVSMENITLNWYWGNNRSMLVSNCLFRMGGAAILLSNRSSDRRRSKYQLIHAIRTHKGADDKCYSCVFQEEDNTKRTGVAISKDLMVVAGEALKTNLTTLGPLVLPMSEQLLFFVTLVVKKVFKMKIKSYIPDFKLAFEHFCIHAGGRAVLDELQKNLELSEWHMEPSRMTLYRFGNTSSSSLWYELAYLEAKGRVQKGDRTWQIAFGSGFKCNSAVWRALKTINPAKEKNSWVDEIHEFPVHVPKVEKIGSLF